MLYRDLLDKIKLYAEETFQKASSDYCYHGLGHTLAVVKSVEEMADYYQLKDTERFIVLCAAYFHDLGYFNGGSENHEHRSARLAEDFLIKEHIDIDLITQIKNCILATQLPQHPNNLLESILCDADLYHLGTTDFKEKSKLILQEVETTKNKKIGKNLWRKMNILLFQEHSYHTDYAKNKLEKQKKENLDILLKEEKDKKNKEKDKKPERGIETMFRITSANNQRLSDMADNKANILLTVNSIILSLVVTVLLRRLDNETHLLIPTIILMLFVVTTMIFAILSTIPKIPNGYSDIHNIKTNRVNLLFFGNFYKMNYEEYAEGIGETMESSKLLYDMLTKDIYSQGVSIGRKYALLRYAYGIFMLGLILSVLAFSIAVITV